MTLHATGQYIKYRWKAKGRHGIHSPFVYTFIEDVLNGKKQIEDKSSFEFPDLQVRYKNLFLKAIRHYDYKNIKRLPGTEKDDLKNSFDVLMLSGATPLQWETIASDYFPAFKNDSAVFVLNIHKTAKHTQEWNRLCNHQKVKLSIDLFGVGLLFFKEEFKEKQHFVLR